MFLHGLKRHFIRVKSEFLLLSAVSGRQGAPFPDFPRARPDVCRSRDESGA
jgi:hypothetical protein